MKIRKKLYLGLGFLFLFIFSIAVVGSRYIQKLSSDSREVLMDNYNTLSYAQQMNRVMDDITELYHRNNLSGKEFAALKDTFRVCLQKQEQNITEVGEKQLTEELRYDFDKLGAIHASDTSNQVMVRDLLLRMRRSIYRISETNMKAIKRKNGIAGEISRKAILWLIAGSAVCFLIALLFIVRFSNYIANPLKRLSKGISEIANRNYSQRLSIKTGDELENVAENFNYMASKLEEYERSNLADVLLEKNRLHAVVNNITDGIMGLEENNRILFVNPLMSEILSIEKKKLEGQPALGIAETNDLFRIITDRIGLFHKRTEEKTGDPLRVIVQNKELLFSVELHEASVGNTYGSDKLRVGHVIVMKNITPFIEKDQAKTHLIATVSHELKTPVASIRLSLKLLEDIRVGNLNPEQKELLASIHSDTDRLSRIIAELLNMAQVESGKLQLDVQPCDPRSLIAYALNAVTLQAEQRNIRIRQEIPEHLPQVSADREKTAWVLINLLINAIRYSPENSVIRLESQLSAKEWRLSVRDEGKGIQKEHRDRIFDKYFQVPGQPPGSGTGLGLAIAREFMEAQGGRIGVQSEENKGSTFYITLPLQV